MRGRREEKVSEGRAEDSAEDGKGKSSHLPRVNLRTVLFAAVGISFGIFLYLRIRLGGLVPSDFLFLAVFLPLPLTPFTKRKIITVICVFTVFAAAGATGIHIYTESYLSGRAAGTYTVEGTVTLISAENGYTDAELSDLLLDGEGAAGKLAVTVSSEAIRPGDRIVFTAKISRIPLPTGTKDAYDFINDIRYRASAEAYEDGEKGFHPLLFLNAELYDLMTDEMEGEEGTISYALLTGNARMADSDFMTAVRRGGIAHIFAVSGLHIGILYGAVMLVFGFLRRYASFPAIFVCTLYCGLCGWTVSALRALIMCIVLSVNVFLGRKSDLLTSISLAAVLVLLIFPAQWLSVGFRLSFGACIGLALFSGSLSRWMKRVHIPRILREYLSASLAVQIFTFPILIETFGYFSVWGLGLNLLIVPLLPFAFLTLLLCTLLSLIIPPAAAFFLIFPRGLFAVLLFLFAAVDFGWVLTGFAFGSAGVVWLCAAVYATQRVRLKTLVRVGALLASALLMAVCLIAENALFGGVILDVTAGEDTLLALVRTENASVLIVGGDASLRECRDFLACHTGHIDAAVVLSEEPRERNVAAFTGAEKIYCLREQADGFHETEVLCGDRFEVGELSFAYVTDEALLLYVRGHAVLFDVRGTTAASSDLLLEKPCGTLKYFLNDGIILLL